MFEDGKKKKPFQLVIRDNKETKKIHKLWPLNESKSFHNKKTIKGPHVSGNKHPK